MSRLHDILSKAGHIALFRAMKDRLEEVLENIVSSTEDNAFADEILINSLRSLSRHGKLKIVDLATTLTNEHLLITNTAKSERRNLFGEPLDPENMLAWRRALREFREKYPKLAPIIEKRMAYHPQDRHTTMQDVENELVKIWKQEDKK